MVNAYIQPTGNQGTINGYVAASKNGQPLYYEALTEKTREVEVQATDPNTGLPLYDSQGKPVMETKTETYKDGEMRPCYATDNAWKKLSLVDFFQKKGSGYSYTSTQAENEDKSAKVYDGFAKTEQPDDQWIKDLDVKYIGNQYLASTANPNGTYTWSVAGDITSKNPLDGIFAGASNIVTLNIGEKLIGVGNYAFYGCNGLNSISFGNGITVIGNWAFAECGSMKAVNIPRECNLAQLGDHAFYSCTQLTDIDIPISVSYIGDYAFAECRYLYEVEICNPEQENGISSSSLKEMGWNVFENDETLYSVTFPDMYSETIGISMFKGCKNLHYVASRNAQFTINSGKADDDVYCFDCFKSMLADDPVNGTFYFEGLNTSLLHTCLLYTSDAADE